MMDHGRLLEQGTHDELLNRRGAYYDLYQAQFAGQEERQTQIERLVPTVPAAPATPAIPVTSATSVTSV